MKYSAFRDYLIRYIAALSHVLNVGIRYKSRTTGRYTIVRTHKVLHMLVSMGSTVLAAALVFPRIRWPNFACGINDLFIFNLKIKCQVLYILYTA